LAKIIALDIGGKRTGIAETDVLQIIASPRETVPTEKLMEHLLKIKESEDFEAVVVGNPLALDGGDSDNSERVRKFVIKLKKQFPTVPVILEDERFSSKMAADAMVKSGMRKKKRREKGQVDQMSAAIILQSYLQGK